MYQTKNIVIFLILKIEVDFFFLPDLDFWGFFVSCHICRFHKRNVVFWEQPDNFIAYCLYTAWGWKCSSTVGIYSSSLILEMLTLSATLKKATIKDSFFSLKDIENRRDQHSLLKGPSGPLLCLTGCRFLFLKLD